MFLILRANRKCFERIFGLAVVFPLRASSTDTTLDSIDNYTQKLVEQKMLRWNVLKHQQKLNKEQQNILTSTRKKLTPKSIISDLEKIRNPNKSPICVDIRNFNVLQLDNLLESSLQSDNLQDFMEILNQIVKHKKIPSDTVCKEVLEIISDKGDLKLLNELIETVKFVNLELYEKNAQFRIILLNCYWTNNNVKKTIQGVREIYETHHQKDDIVYKNLRKFLNSILMDAVNHKSEAVIISLKKLAEEMCLIHNDCYFVYSLWKKCFDSHWYSDQLLADQLIMRFEKLQKILSIESNLLCYTYLRSKNTEAVYRLIEVFLKFNMQKQVESSLKVLLDYQCYRKDLRAASEIVQTCVNLEINLSDEENKKFLALLLNKPYEAPKKEIKVPKYQYKF